MSEKIESTVLPIFTKEDLARYTQTLEHEAVDLSPVGIPGQVLIQELTAGDRDYWEASMLVDAQKGNTLALETGQDGMASSIAGEMMRSRIVALSLAEAGPNGSVVKMYGKRGDEHVIKQWPARVVNLIADKCMDLNGISQESQDQIKKDVAQALSEGTSSNAPEDGDSAQEK